MNLTRIVVEQFDRFAVYSFGPRGVTLTDLSERASELSTCRTTHGATRWSLAAIRRRRVVVSPARYVLLPLASALTGYSVKAMTRKIERGDWQEDKLWRRGPDGRILIDMVGYQKWAEGR
jgi:hypothetical protein